jgi:uroporphyrinogen-III synthase
MVPLLVLRPEPGARTTLERAREMGLDAVAAPLFVIEAVDWKVPDLSAFDGLLLSSANALRYGGQRLTELRGLKAYAVGEATASATREAGFDVAATGDAGVQRLLDSIEPELRLLHLCGADRHQPGARQTITPIIAYRAKTIEQPSLPAGGVALIHSPRAGRRLAELVEDRSKLAVVAISEAAAEAAGAGWRALEVADEPTDDALLALAARLCNNPPPE